MKPWADKTTIHPLQTTGWPGTPKKRGDEPLKYDENGRPLTMSRRVGQTPYTRRTTPLKLQTFAQRMQEKRGAGQSNQSKEEARLDTLSEIESATRALMTKAMVRGSSGPLAQALKRSEETFAQRMSRKRGEGEIRTTLDGAKAEHYIIDDITYEEATMQSITYAAKHWMRSLV